MRPPRPRPRRKMRSELLSLAPILLLAGVLATLFPYGSLRFSAREQPERPENPVFAFANLSAGASEKALEIAGRAISVRPDLIRNERANLLSLESLPPAGARPTVFAADRSGIAGAAAMSCDSHPYPPSLAAARPAPM
ncbi:MAG: hypothetical protein K6F50_05070, partial [Kiritimatiellae bacterium]|nr:hypothetical protein [Kiritimatiellia bacterium]